MLRCGMRCLIVGLLATVVSVSAPVSASAASTGDAGFTVTWADERSSLRINPLITGAGQAVTLRVDTTRGVDLGSGFELDVGAGTVRRLAAGQWRWIAPGKAGAYTLEIRRRDGASMRFTALVTLPHRALQDGLLNGYRIGHYPRHPRDLPLYQPPTGFIHVDARSADLPLTPRLRLGQFVCKQTGGGPPYIVLRERLALALEAAMDRFARAGLASGGLTVMSGYRTPYYNRQLGGTAFSRHQWGDAADVFIDANGDGRMDDLNGDRRHDQDDARLLYRIVEAAQTEAGWQRFSGGLSAYPPTAYHGAFLHLDTRGYKARW